MTPVTMYQEPIVFTYRGDDEEAPENTMSAFVYTHGIRVHHVETDAHVIVDDKVVTRHDEAVDHCFDRSGVIIQMAWRELSKLRHHDPGEQMPLLTQVLETFSDMYLDIDAKESDIESPLLDVVTDHGVADRVLVISFFESRLRVVRDIATSDPTCTVTTSLETEAIVRLVGIAKSAANPAW